jgi:Xaa-Pro aminopeptidase
MFGRAEQAVTTTVATRGDEIEAKLALLRGLLERRGVDAAVLSRTDAVAWLTGGLTNRIEPGNPASPLWLVVTAEHAAALTTNVERPRLDAEARLAGLGLELHEAPWYEPGGLERAAAALAGAHPELIGGLGVDLDDDLVELRLALLPPERERLAALALDAAAALEEALRAWRPGERDFDVQARVAERLERVGAFGACLIVGGDARVERFRHPLAAGEPMRRLVMAVVVAERHGLHAAVTRFASAGRLSGGVRRSRASALAVERSTLAACVPGASYGSVLRALAGAYAKAGHAEAWREHYQGGPIGYRQREVELAPTQTDSRWFTTALAEGHAVAWNPSVAGGGKCEDTYLVEPERLRRLTETGAWPVEEGRPAVLDILTGGTA